MYENVCDYAKKTRHFLLKCLYFLELTKFMRLFCLFFGNIL